MNKVVKLMTNKINWLAWLLLVILWNYGFPNATPFLDVLVAVFLSILFIIIQLLQSRHLQKSGARSKFKN
jgi:hypothetical protein